MINSSRVALVKVRTETQVSSIATRLESSRTIYQYILRFYGQSNAAKMALIYQEDGQAEAVELSSTACIICLSRC